MPTKRKNTKAGTTQPLRAASLENARTERAQQSASQQYVQSPASQPMKVADPQTKGTGAFAPSVSQERPLPARGRATSVRKRFGKPPIAIIVILAILVIVGGLFSWQRWFRYSDAQDMQGTWIVADSSAQVVFTEDKMTFIEDTSYNYTIDATGKTIAYTFSDLSGTSHYRFSLDRTKLAVMEKTDGSKYSAMETFGSDLVWTIRALVTHVIGSELDPSVGANADRVSCVLLARGL